MLFEAIYFVEDGDYTVSMDTQQAVNLRLLDVFADLGITLAYPTTRSLSLTVAEPSPAQPG